MSIYIYIKTAIYIPPLERNTRFETHTEQQVHCLDFEISVTSSYTKEKINP